DAVMRTTNGHTLDAALAKLASLSQPQLLQAIAFMQHRRNVAAVMLGLLQPELHRRLSAPATKNQAELLTIKDVARLLKVAKARAYELTRTAVIPSVKVGERQVRV